MKNKLMKKNTFAQKAVVEQYYVPCQCDGPCSCGTCYSPYVTAVKTQYGTKIDAQPSATTHN